MLSLKLKEQIKNSLYLQVLAADTLFGAEAYCVMAPEHPFVKEITTPEQMEAVLAYRKSCESKSDLERTELNKEKTGVFTGAYAINPVNGKEIPIWISDYVLAEAMEQVQSWRSLHMIHVTMNLQRNLAWRSLKC